MNDQTAMMVRWAITALGGVLAQKGWISNADLTSVTANLFAAIGPVMMLGTALWGAYVHSHAAKVAAANAMLNAGTAMVNSDAAGMPKVVSVPK